MWNWGKAISPRVIKTLLKKEINPWLDSIEDKEVQELARKNAIVCGGAIAAYLTGNKPNDIDVYFMDGETVKRVAEYYINLFSKKNSKMKNRIFLQIDEEKFGDTVKPRYKPIIKSAGIASDNQSDDDYEYFEGTDPTGDKAEDYAEKMLQENTEEKHPYTPTFITTNAISLTNNIQIVVRFYGKPDEIFDNYDFTHCMSYYIPSGGELVIPDKVRRSLMERRLYFNSDTKYPLSSLFRVNKFTQRGFVISATEYTKIALRLNDFDLTNVETLEEQLIGVDVAYFLEFLDSIREQQKQGKEITATYLATVLDKMYG